MKSHSSHPVPQEVELKLSLPGADPAKLRKRLAGLPLFASHQALRQSLHNIYFDTPEQHLRQQRVALRLRRMGGAAQPQWLQTLKTCAQDESALSRRGEWECTVPGAALSLDALKSTPWTDLDPIGGLFERLMPCFQTNFERTSWLLSQPDGAVVEVALDIGQIEAGTQSAPICELELELKAGTSAALFDVARQIALCIAVLPANQSKAERGFLLAQGQLGQPRRAQPPLLGAKMSHAILSQRVLREMFTQFTANLNALCNSDDPEVVHQARVGWRRFRSALRLFKKLLAIDVLPAWPELFSLLTFLGELRNLDVALTETLPPLADAYCEADPQRAQAWQATLSALTTAAMQQRKAVRYAMKEPSVGHTLLVLTECLDQLGVDQEGVTLKKGELRRWAASRVTRLERRLAQAQQSAVTPEQQHRVRIHAKRLRYAVLALRDLLPQPRANALQARAQAIQTALGASRDLMQACALAAAHDGSTGLVDFLRGVVVGSSRVSASAATQPSSN